MAEVKSGLVKGRVFNIQKFSVNDGNGIRTSIFFAGCPLHCQWCANPEGLIPDNSMVKEMTVEQIAEIIHMDDIFFRNSKGGITFTGGEATVQLNFLKQLVNLFYDENYDLALETCGYFDFIQVLPVLEKMNLIFMDLKLFKDCLHEKYTGKSNKLILNNIKRTSELCKSKGSEFVVRIPIIEGVNADAENLSNTIDFLSSEIPFVKVELLPYHKYGEMKYNDLDIPLPLEEFKIPTENRMKEIKKMFEQKGIPLADYR